MRPLRGFPTRFHNSAHLLRAHNLSRPALIASVAVLGTAAYYVCSQNLRNEIRHSFIAAQRSGRVLLTLLVCVNE